MNEDQLRDALRADASTSSSAGDWNLVRVRARAIGRRRLAASASVGIAVVALVAGGIFGTGMLDGDEDRQIVAASHGADYIAVTSDGRLLEMTFEGEIVHEIARDDLATPVGYPYPPSISVTPDGSAAYASRIGYSECPNDPSGPARPGFARIPLAGGEAQPIVGDLPAVSPDGRWLAYVGDLDATTCGMSNALVLRDLMTGEERRFPAGGPDDRQVNPVLWNRDSESLLVQLASRSFGQVVALRVDAAPTTLSGLPALALGDQADRLVGALATNELVAVEAPSVSGDSILQLPVRVVALDPVSGVQTRMLFDVDDPNVVQGIVGTTVTIDPTGTAMMFTTTEPPPATASRRVYYWREGDAEPTAVPNNLGIVAAAMLPDERPPDAMSTTTTLGAPATPSIVGPEGMLVVTAAGDLKILDLNGNPPPNYYPFDPAGNWRAVAIDNGGFYSEVGSSDRCDNSGLLGRLDARAGLYSYSDLGSGAFPAVSEDGTKLAYRVGACGTDARLVVRDVAAGVERSWTLAQPDDGGSAAELVGPVAWAADGERLLVKVNREPTTELWYVDTTSRSATLGGHVLALQGEQGSERGIIDAKPRGATGRWAGVHRDENGDLRLVEFDIDTETIRRTLVDLPDTSATIAGVDPTGDSLLLLIDLGSGRNDLFRWHEGDPAPWLVMQDVRTADW